MAVGYWKATRHPWPCLLFLLPLLLAYELGVIWLGGAQPQLLRNGADAWFRWTLQEIGLAHDLFAPVVVLLLLIVWNAATHRPRPGDVATTILGMCLESFLLALGLWALSHALVPLLHHYHIELTTANPQPAFAPVVTYVGAGIYEEVLFRLMLYAGLLHLLRLASLPGWQAAGFAGLTSALLFAAAHHIGPNGEEMDSFVFLFRTLAGLYFAAIFQLRGFGIAVGTHAAYDLLVGLAIG